jgi:hypothetical protein
MKSLATFSFQKISKMSGMEMKSRWRIRRGGNRKK